MFKPTEEKLAKKLAKEQKREEKIKKLEAEIEARMKEIRMEQERIEHNAQEKIQKYDEDIAAIKAGTHEETNRKIEAGQKKIDNFFDTLTEKTDNFFDKIDTALERSARKSGAVVDRWYDEFEKMLASDYPDLYKEMMKIQTPYLRRKRMDEIEKQLREQRRKDRRNSMFSMFRIRR